MAPAAAAKSNENGGPFARVRDKRLVRQVLSTQHQPHHWVPMDVSSTECKLMEVRKFSAEYHNIDVKFRQPNLELICVYAVQNPFLYGMYELRREQMKMQQESLQAKWRTGLKEKQFFYPTTFENLEAILRHNFNTVAPLDDEDEDRRRQQEVKFYTHASLANNAFRGTTNPRLLVLGNVLIGLCHTVPSGASNKDPSPPRRRSSSLGVSIDTWCNHDKTLFYKQNATEMYPDHVLVYRDVPGPPDAHTSRLRGFLQHCQISYRAGARYNPQEQSYQGQAADEIRVVVEEPSVAATTDKPVTNQKKKEKKKK